jgi:hypothetical protein
VSPKPSRPIRDEVYEIVTAEAMEFMRLPGAERVWEEAREYVHGEDKQKFVGYLTRGSAGSVAATMARTHHKPPPDDKRLRLFTEDELRAYMAAVDLWPEDDLTRQERARLAVECDHRARQHSVAVIQFNRRARFYGA